MNGYEFSIPEGGAPYSVDAHNAAAFQAYKDGYRKALKLENWQQTPLERGTIDGIPFTRIRWDADCGLVPGKLHGFYYVARDRGKILTINSFGAEDDVLKRREAAVLTLRKR